MRARAQRTRSEKPAVPRLLFDVEETAEILCLTIDAVDRLCQMGQLHPSITVGNRRLFTVRDLEEFTRSGTPKKIQLSAREVVQA